MVILFRLVISLWEMPARDPLREGRWAMDRKKDMKMSLVVVSEWLNCRGQDDGPFLFFFS